MRIFTNQEHFQISPGNKGVTDELVATSGRQEFCTDEIQILQRCRSCITCSLLVCNIKGAFVWDQSGIRIIGVMRVSVCLGAILIPEYLDFHSGYSTPRSRIAGIYSEYKFRNKFLFRNIPNERALSLLSSNCTSQSTNIKISVPEVNAA